MRQPNRTNLIAGILLSGVGTFASFSVAGGQDTPRVPAAESVGLTMQSSGFVSDSLKPRSRPRAIEYSDWYARRLLIHKIGSYTMLPLFATEYYLGEQLGDDDDDDGERESGSNKDLHVAVATTIGALFTVNTVTGLWNLWDSRKDPAGRTKRLIHSALMIGSEAGFVLAASVAEEGDSDTHKNIALTSMGISTVGTAMMWFFK